jgi:hypothetical protein
MPHAFTQWSRSALVVALTLLSSCTMGRVHDRMSYWTKQTHDNLPSGTSLADAEKFFTAHGLKLACCVLNPDKQYFALERKVGRFFITEYDVAILVTLSDTQQVAAVEVERWGVGL